MIKVLRKKIQTQFEARRIIPSLLKAIMNIKVRNSAAKIWTQLWTTWVEKQICSLKKQKKQSKLQIQFNRRGTTRAKNLFNQLNYNPKNSANWKIHPLIKIILSLSKNKQKKISFIKSCQSCKMSQVPVCRPSQLYLKLTQLCKKKCKMPTILFFHLPRSKIRPVK